MKRLLLALCVLSAPCWSAGLTVNQVASGVEALCHDRDSMACAYYFIGVLDGYAATPGAPLFCPPKEETTRQLVRVAVKYMQQHPETGTQPAAATAIVAWAAAYGCAGK